MSSNLSSVTWKILLMKSGGRCSFPKCQNKLYSEATDQDPIAVLAEIAHIYGEKPTSARYDKSKDEKWVNSIDNLTGMCPTHHTLIDKQPLTYPVEWLFKIKKEHEEFVQEAIISNVQKVTFNELNQVTAGILSTMSTSSGDFTVLDPAAKMERNNLSEAIRPKLTIGLGKSNEVRKFINIWEPNNFNFGNRLKRGFELEYMRLNESGYQGDLLFNELHQFACGGRHDILLQAAGLAVLAYFFEACEVFSK